MGALIDVILPVFIVIGAGYLAVWRKLFPDEGVTFVMKFAQNFAIPCLLFTGVAKLDIGQNFNLPLLVSFYTGAITGFVVGMLGGRFIFKRSWEDAIAFGFIGLFSNSLLLGVPITERAYGADALVSNFAIIAIHSPLCYAIGITAMEITQNKGGSLAKLPGKVLNAMFHNALIVGITLGAIVNLGNIPLPNVLWDAIGLMTRAGLPAALFALGGVLYRYRPEGDMRAILFMVFVSLIIHPTVTWTMGKWLGITQGEFRSAVLTASMAPGVNAFLFANMYQRAMRVAASTVLIATAASILTVWGWLLIIP
ncbi:AEC family transporter [Marivivens sp. LCG002]|uniref:AEC family transporter n=1 Tax=Marivivens sp. LCG002 TaxID=3051171 RepID=UPI002555524E|nr:AEC family transporter [Marivivens sp. LCG002]WIV49861.1 AEC family transporter [Marivivens sp. LCG002]